jgi:hypothetical protein
MELLGGTDRSEKLDSSTTAYSRTGKWETINTNPLTTWILYLGLD